MMVIPYAGRRYAKINLLGWYGMYHGRLCRYDRYDLDLLAKFYHWFPSS